MLQTQCQTHMFPLPPFRHICGHKDKKWPVNAQINEIYFTFCAVRFFMSPLSQYCSLVFLIPYIIFIVTHFSHNNKTPIPLYCIVKNCPFFASFLFFTIFLVIFYMTLLHIQMLYVVVICANVAFIQTVYSSNS